MPNWATVASMLPIECKKPAPDFMSDIYNMPTREELVNKLIYVVYQFIKVHFNMTKSDVKKLSKLEREVLLIHCYYLQYEAKPTGLVKEMLLK